MSGTIEDIAKKWLAEPAYNKVSFFLILTIDRIEQPLFGTLLTCMQPGIIYS